MNGTRHAATADIELDWDDRKTISVDFDFAHETFVIAFVRIFADERLRFLHGVKVDQSTGSVHDVAQLGVTLGLSDETEPRVVERGLAFPDAKLVHLTSSKGLGLMPDRI